MIWVLQVHVKRSSVNTNHACAQRKFVCLFVYLLLLLFFCFSLFCFLGGGAKDSYSTCECSYKSPIRADGILVVVRCFSFLVASQSMTKESSCHPEALNLWYFEKVQFPLQAVTWLIVSFLWSFHCVVHQLEQVDHADTLAEKTDNGEVDCHIHLIDCTRYIHVVWYPFNKFVPYVCFQISAYPACKTAVLQFVKRVSVYA